MQAHATTRLEAVPDAIKIQEGASQRRAWVYLQVKEFLHCACRGDDGTTFLRTVWPSKEINLPADLSEW
jgi:hypothetical protein